MMLSFSLRYLLVPVSTLLLLRVLYERGLGLAAAAIGLACCRADPSDFFFIFFLLSGLEPLLFFERLDNVFFSRNAILEFSSFY